MLAGPTSQQLLLVRRLPDGWGLPLVPLAVSSVGPSTVLLLGVARNTVAVHQPDADRGGGERAGGDPEGIEVHATTGDADLMAKVVARGTADLYRITNEILEIDGIQRTSTAISVLELMPPRYDALLARLSEQESRPAD